VADDAARHGGERELPRVDRPLAHLALEFDRLEMRPERRQEHRADRHPPVLAVLARLEGPGLIGECPLDVEPARRPVDVHLPERGGLPPAEARQEARQDERSPAGAMTWAVARSWAPSAGVKNASPLRRFRQARRPMKKRRSPCPPEEESALTA
jgi:hypothetical protein